MENFTSNSVKTWFTLNTISNVLPFVLNLFYAIVILLVAMIFAAWIRRRIFALSTKYQRLDATLFHFLANLARYLILAIAIIFLLGRFGIQTTSLVAMLGAAGLAVGLALQGTLSNLASGVMLLAFRPFRIGDLIEGASQFGVVQGISLFVTELKTYDGIKVIVSNSELWSSAIKNYSANPIRMIDITVGVSYTSDLKRTSAVLNTLAQSDKRILEDPAPFIKVKNLGDSSIDFCFRVWVETPDWWVTQCELTERIKLALDEAGIDIPFPTRTLVKVDGDEKDD